MNGRGNWQCHTALSRRSCAAAAVRGTCSEVEVDIKQGLIVALLLLRSADDDVVVGGRSKATTPGTELTHITFAAPIFAARKGGSLNKIDDEVRSGCRCSDYSYCGRVALKIIPLRHHSIGSSIQESHSDLATLQCEFQFDWESLRMAN